MLLRAQRRCAEETVPGKYWRVEASSDLRFSQQLDATLSLNGERDRRRANDSRFADVLIPRLRVAYQFTPELALRTIGEFRVQRGYDTAGDISSRERSLSLDFLASYYVRPGTVVYVGYGSLLRGETARTLSVWHNNLFVKLSYLWQG